jgi:dCTP deaminase
MTKVIAGVLPSQSIQKMIERGEIDSRGATIDSSQVQPASLDLRLGIVAYRVRASFLTVKILLLMIGCKNLKCTK